MDKLFENYSLAWSEDSVRLQATPSYLAKTSFFYIQECGYFKTDENYFTERKNLKSYLIILTIDGEGVLEYDGKSYSIIKDELFFIDCTKHHRYFCPGNKKWEFIWFHFNAQSASAYYNLFSENSTPVVKASLDLLNQMNRILALTKKKTRDSELLISLLITEILTDIITDLHYSEREPVHIPDYIKKAAKIINTRFAEGINVSNVCDCIGISPSYLSREFKKYTGVTPLNYITSCRINYAKELLKTTDLSVEEVAYKTGMNSVNRFIIRFSQLEGMTPHVYRTQWR